MAEEEGIVMRRKPHIGFLGLAVFLIATTGTPRASAADTIWHIKGVHPKGHWLDIKAIAPNGKMYDIKAIQQDDNVHMLDVKAIVGAKRYPVKIVVSDDRYGPVMAINVNGRNLPIKALTPEGKRLDVKGVRRTGTIIHIKAIGLGGRFFGVKAISPQGRMYDVKGIKMTKDRVEMMIDNVQIHAHVKAIPQAGDL